MSRPVASAILVAVMVVLVVGVDILFFRNHFWPRLLSNVGIVLVAVAVYLRFVKNS